MDNCHLSNRLYNDDDIDDCTVKLLIWTIVICTTLSGQQFSVGGQSKPQHILIPAKTPLVWAGAVARLLCNLLYDDLQPGSPSMAP